MSLESDNGIQIAIIVPQREEYEAIKKLFKIPTSAVASALQHGGSYVRCEIQTVLERDRVAPLSLAIACMNEMYNHPTLALTERLLFQLRPKVIFLLGSACGNIRKVRVCDVVVLTDAVHYLGRGRLQKETINPRPHTVHISTRMKDAITDHMVYHAERFYRWNRTCHNLLRAISQPSQLPDDALSRRQNFEIKTGIIASDDMVLSWSDRDKAEAFWAQSLEFAQAYDMESAGFSHGCSYRENPPLWTVVRGISDHGVEGEPKYHLAAATVAGQWLRGFIENGLGRIHPAGSGEFDQDSSELMRTYNWKRLYNALFTKERRNDFVGKGRFIREELGSQARDIKALELAISKGAIVEYEIPSETGRSRSVIRLDKQHEFWYIVLS